jgi:hypothetical protein
MKEIKAEAITWHDVKAMQERIGGLEEMLKECEIMLITGTQEHAEECAKMVRRCLDKANRPQKNTSSDQ